MKLPKWMVPSKLRNQASPAGISSEEGAKNQSSLSGIGVVFSVGPDKGFYIKNMTPGGAAYDSGILREGDMLISVDGKETTGKSADYVTNKILGKLGT
jgi:C-terminal processing protease CtpA/Prc